MKPHRKAIFAALLIFVSGAGIGAGVGAWLASRAILKMVQSDPQDTALADLVVNHIYEDLSHELKLDEPTKAVLLRELQHSAGEVKKARAEGLRLMIAAFEQASARVAGSLPADKREEFQRRTRERFERAGFSGFLPPKSPAPVVPPSPSPAPDKK